MVRKKLAKFRAAFERLENRDLMTADLSLLYRSTHLDISWTDSLAATAQQLVGSSVTSLTMYSAGHGSSFIPPTSATHNPTSKPTSTPAAKPDWFDQNISDLALRNLVRQDVNKDHVLNRSDMLGIFGEVEQDGKVTSNELTSLKHVVGNTSYFVGVDYVDVLSSDVVNGNAANAHYRGSTLGNLTAGASSKQLDELVHKWFYGDDHPALTPGWGLRYQKAAGSLFPHTPSYVDVHQGIIGDCYLLASLGEAAIVNPNLITNMFIVNGDGTYTVRFYHNNVADYVTVDSQLPVNDSGTYLYANLGQNIHSSSTPLWVALVEKAYAQMNESGWLRADVGDTGHNSYDALSGGYMFDALNQMTNQRTGDYYVNQNVFTSLYNSGKLITFGSIDNPIDRSVVGDHAYAVLSYNVRTQQVTLFNPWGLNNGYAPATVMLTWTQLNNDFGDMEFTF
ncbi:MAG: peptidase C2 calpain [Planctomycetia bacterium]|nr:peptidase C2 calpain [Planctomycetia bacterium]